MGSIFSLLSRKIYSDEAVLEDEESAIEKGSLGSNTDSDECSSTIMVYVHKNGLGYNINSTQEFTWTDLLEQFSSKLLPDPEYYQRGIIIASHVFSIIRYFRQDVARVKIGGSVGKHTGISTDLLQINKTQKHIVPEFDLYIFLNLRNPSFKNLNEELKNSINALHHLLPQFCWLNEMEQKSSDSKAISGIHFKIEGKIYHLYPAINFVEIQQKDTFHILHPLIQTLITESKHFVEVQRMKTLGVIQKSDTSQRNIYFPSLEESYIRFFKNRPRVFRQTIRLVKYWNHTSHLGAIEKRSNNFLMELCAMKAIAVCETSDLYDIICKFMELVIDFPNLKVAFQMDEENLVEYQEYSMQGNNISITVDIPTLDENVTSTSMDEINFLFTKRTLIHSLPCILDPCNPFNNLGDMGLNFWNELKLKACTTLSRLKEESNRSEEFIQDIFET